MRLTTHLRSNPKERDSSERFRTNSNQASYGTLTLHGTAFKPIAPVAALEHASRLQFAAEAVIFSLSSSLFIRHYWVIGSESFVTNRALTATANLVAITM
jgi:hypothetical protein